MIKHFSDHIGNIISVPYPPATIVSLVPSQTELLASLGLDKQVAGITKFCVYPAGWLKTKRIVGGTKNFHFDVIDELKPDIILANKEENYREGIEQLKVNYPVWVSDINTWDDSLSMIRDIGLLTGKEREAANILERVRESFASLVPFSGNLTVLYLIWKEPWMGAASGTFIHSMLSKAGLFNSLQSFARYPELSAEQIRRLSPDIIFLSSEPFPFKEKHVGELKAISPASKVMLVNGEIFSWYGSRLMEAVPYLNGLIHQLEQVKSK